MCIFRCLVVCPRTCSGGLDNWLRRASALPAQIASNVGDHIAGRRERQEPVRKLCAPPVGFPAFDQRRTHDAMPGFTLINTGDFAVGVYYGSMRIEKPVRTIFCDEESQEEFELRYHVDIGAEPRETGRQCKQQFGLPNWRCGRKKSSRRPRPEPRSERDQASATDGLASTQACLRLINGSIS